MMKMPTPVISARVWPVRRVVCGLTKRRSTTTTAKARAATSSASAKNMG